MNIYTFAEYSYLFKNDDKKVILSEIKNLNFELCCKILSALGFYQRNADRDILSKTLLYYFPELNNDVIADYLKHTDIVSRHGVLLAWKYLLANNLNSSSSFSEDIIKYIFKLILIMQEHYLNNDISNNMNFFMSNSIFNYYDCQVNQLARSYYIFIKNKYFKSKIVNISLFKNSFNEEYGISLEKYIYSVQMLISYINGLNESRYHQHYFPLNYQIDPYNLPGLSKDVLPHLINILDKLSFNYNHGKKWCKESILDEFEISLFVNKPLIKINSNCYIPIERKLFEDLIFNSLFHKVRNCYEKDNREFIDSFGFMFEDYVEWITLNMCKRAKGYYNIIKEFSYGKNERKSPDIMVLHKDKDIGDAVLIIEVKTARPLYSLSNYINPNTDDIIKSVKKLVTYPVIQSIKSINDIIETKSHIHITKEKTYYFLSVTMNNIPYNYFDTNEITTEIRKKYSNLRIGSYNSISVEEFELFLQVLMFPGNGPFSYYLENYRKDFELNGNSFKNYIKKYPKAKDINRINSTYYDPITILSKECIDKASKYFFKSNLHKVIIDNN